MSLCIVMLTGMVALTVDVGSSFMHRRNLQGAADAGVLAGAHLALEDVIYNRPASSARYDLQRSTAVNFAKYNGTIPSDAILVQWVDGSGNPFPNDAFNRPVVGAGTVQGMKVTITGNRDTLLFKTLGIATVGLSVTAMAQFGTPSALIGPIPLALNYDTVPRDGLGNPVLYQPVLLQTQSGVLGGAVCCTSGQIDNAGKPIPAAYYPPATPLGPTSARRLSSGRPGS
jgi:Flp pilus assembly protein TadG